MREADEPHNLRGRKSRRGSQQAQTHLPPEHLVPFPIFILRHGHRGQAASETRPERHPRRPAQGHRQRYHRFQLETQLERPDRPDTAARAQATRLRHVAWPRTVQAVPPASCARYIPRLLGLRRRRLGRHGPALSRSGSVHHGQGQRKPGRDRVPTPRNNITTPCSRGARSA